MAINNEEQLKTAVSKMGTLGGANLPGSITEEITATPDTLLDTEGTLLDPVNQLTTAQADPTGLSNIAATATQGLGQLTEVAEITPQIGEAKAATIDTDMGFEEIQGTVSPESIGVAATAELDERATTSFQLGKLMSSIEAGEPLPAWAAPAVRKISGVMQARGLGSSSMAAMAMTQAVLESGIGIAADDAKKYQTMQLANLNNTQQMALKNSATFAAMDKANLSARMQSAVTNAQILLATETKNMQAQQQANTLSYNALTQALFKDAAADNARLQLNAKNEIQVEEFFAELGAQVETANANRLAAMEQFNTSEENAMTQYSASLRDARDKFNANMQYAVDQSNAVWRRDVNTANTAAQNESNRIDVQNVFNASQNALNNLWQQYRDVAAWNFQKGESYLQRQHEVGIMAMEFANTKELYKQEQKDALAMGIGNWVAAWMGASGSGDSG